MNKLKVCALSSAAVPLTAAFFKPTRRKSLHGLSFRRNRRCLFNVQKVNKSSGKILSSKMRMR